MSTDVVTDVEVLDAYPWLPITQSTVGHYRGWLAKQFLVRACRSCSTLHIPWQAVCPACWSTDLATHEVVGTGAVHLRTTLFRGVPADDIDYEAGHQLVSVELDDQPHLYVTAQTVTSPGECLAIGDRVRLCWRERGGHPVPAFVHDVEVSSVG